MEIAAPAELKKPLRWHQAIDDVASGFRLTHIWALLGTHDIKQRYRRSTLGPFWLTLSMAVLIVSMGTLYSRLFNQDPAKYLPFLAVGLLLWTFISTSVSELCQAFIAADTLIKQVRLPLTAHVARVVWRNLLILAHNAVIMIPVALWAGKATVLGVITSIAGLFVLAASAVFLGLILGIICTRFRDIPQIVASVMQILFFMTPIMWPPEVLGTNIWIAKINPIYHYVEIVRSPLIIGPIPAMSWMLTLSALVLLAAFALLMLARFGRRVAYWV
jgi:ABC-type polysaccharide/polyol phosphate export permease